MCNEKQIVINDIKDFTDVAFYPDSAKSIYKFPVCFDGFDSVCDQKVMSLVSCLILYIERIGKEYCIIRKKDFNETNFLSISIKPGERLSFTEDALEQLKNKPIRIVLRDPKIFDLNAYMRNYQKQKSDPGEDCNLKDNIIYGIESPKIVNSSITKIGNNVFKKEIVMDNGEKTICWFKDETNTSYAKRENDFPNRVTYYTDGGIKCQEWVYSEYEKIVNFSVRDDDLPNRISYDEHGHIIEEEWMSYIKFGDKEVYIERENFEDPNRICYYDTGVIKSKEWFSIAGNYNIINDRPSKITYHNNGEIKTLEWLNNNYAKRFDEQPNYIEFTEYGELKYEKWFKHGSNVLYEIRPLNFPNYIEYTEDGKHEKWLIKDDEYMNLGPNMPNEIIRSNDGKADRINHRTIVFGNKFKL